MDDVARGRAENDEVALAHHAEVTPLDHAPRHAALACGDIGLHRARAEDGDERVALAQHAVDFMRGDGGGGREGFDPDAIAFVGVHGIMG